MKSRPILFSAPMVRALLDGRKTQTRRIVKLNAWVDEGDCDYTGQCVKVGEYIDLRRCPYGRPGDQLWVRETWRTDKSLDDETPSKFWGWPVRYEADDKVSLQGAFYGEANGKKRVSIHMPRWASRITLEITGVRVERLNEISEADAKAEGIESIPLPSENMSADPVTRYRWLWESLNGPGSWDANPWVWVIEFKRVTP